MLSSYTFPTDLLYDFIGKKDVSVAIRHFESEMENYLLKLTNLAPSIPVESVPFRSIVGKNMLQQLEEAVLWLQNYARLFKNEPVKTLYTEMNGFDINPDSWYADLFLYWEEFTTNDSEDFFADWDGAPKYQIDSFIIHGFESLQNDFLHYDGFESFITRFNLENNQAEMQGLCDTFNALRWHTVYLVMLNFQLLMQKAHELCRIHKHLVGQIPLYSTIHDCDIILQSK